MAEQYADLISIVREKVKPQRDGLKREHRRSRWWLYGEVAPSLYAAVSPLSRVLVRAEVSEQHILSFVPNNLVYSHMLVVFALDDYYHFGLLQSSIHESWVWKHASSLESRNRYTPSDCFISFPFPQELQEQDHGQASRVADEYYAQRRETMLARSLGLNKTYNLFHDDKCQDADVVRLRNLHIGMDKAILACYGWQDLDPKHNFHQNDRGRTRFTISPTARREVLARLLELNHQLAAQEQERTLPLRQSRKG